MTGVQYIHDYYTASEMNMMESINSMLIWHAWKGPLGPHGTNGWIHYWSNSYVALACKTHSRVTVGNTAWKSTKLWKYCIYKRHFSHFIWTLKYCSAYTESCSEFYERFARVVNFLFTYIFEQGICRLSNKQVQMSPKITCSKTLLLLTISQRTSTHTFSLLYFL